MKFGDFIINNIGKKVDFDGAYGAQCVDLVRQGIKDIDVFNIPQPEGVEGAQDFYLNHDKRPVQNKYLRKVEISVIGQPIPSGAIVVFKATATNKFGHVGFCVRTEGNLIYLFEQDGFKQDGAKISAWSYGNILGYLVKKE